MIISISGPERCFKDGLGAYICTHLINPATNEPIFEFDIKRAFGNIHMYKTPYPWETMKTKDLLVLMSKYIETQGTNCLFYISEADKFLPARNYKDKFQLGALTGIWQGQKMKTAFIHNWHPGDPDEPVAGEDIILRSMSSYKYRIKYFSKEGNWVFGEYRDIMNGLPPMKFILPDTDKYYSYWNHNEPAL